MPDLVDRGRCSSVCRSAISAKSNELPRGLICGLSAGQPISAAVSMGDGGGSLRLLRANYRTQNLAAPLRRQDSDSRWDQSLGGRPSASIRRLRYAPCGRRKRHQAVRQKNFLLARNAGPRMRELT